MDNNEMLEVTDFVAGFVSAKGNASLAFGKDYVGFGTDLTPKAADALFGCEEKGIAPLLVKKTSKEGAPYLGSASRLRIRFHVTGENTRELEDGTEDHTTFVFIDDVAEAPDLISERAKALLAR